MPNSTVRTLLSLSFVVVSTCCAAGSVTHPDRASAARAAVDCKPGDFPATCPTKDDYNQATTQFDLAASINLTGRVARMHYSILAPGGVIGQHSHKNRPCFEYMLEGEATETKQVKGGKVIVRRVKAGEVELETSDVTHWWKNESRRTLRMIAVDIFADAAPKFCGCAGATRTTPFTPPVKTGDVKIETLGTIELGQEYPDIAQVKDYVMRSRRFTLRPHQTTALQNSSGRPSYTYIVKGSPIENRSDEEPSARRPEEYSIADGNVSYFWENPTSRPVVLWVVDFVKKSER